jgi:hypothetical protein
LSFRTMATRLESCGFQKSALHLKSINTSESLGSAQKQVSGVVEEFVRIPSARDF